MGGRIFTVVALAFVWTILVEEFSWITAGTGVAIGVACVLFLGKFLPSEKILDVNFIELSVFPFWLIWKVYLGGIVAVTKFILRGTADQVGMTTVETRLKSEFLRVILADADTFTPGTVFLKMTDTAITILWIGKEEEAVHDLLRIEDKLLESQK